jgi:hypothetical protein
MAVFQEKRRFLLLFSLPKVAVSLLIFLNSFPGSPQFEHVFGGKISLEGPHRRCEGIFKEIVVVVRAVFNLLSRGSCEDNVINFQTARQGVEFL